MKTRVSLRPGDKGTKQLHAENGDRLVCVRYRYDAKAIAARWDPEKKIWRMRFKDALDLNLQDRILPEKNSL